MLIEDYVCGMQVNEGENQIMYRGGSYSFCSRQCRERFQTNPHLYVGIAGQKAPKQEGVSVIKQRRLRLAYPLLSGQEKMLVDALQTMMGIQAASVEGERVTITYDLLQATEEQIENKLAEIGIQLGDGFADRLRRAFVHYEEECEAGNLEVHANDIEPLYEALWRGER